MKTTKVTEPNYYYIHVAWQYVKQMFSLKSVTILS